MIKQTQSLSTFTLEGCLKLVVVPGHVDVLRELVALYYQYSHKCLEKRALVYLSEEILKKYNESTFTSVYVFQDEPNPTKAIRGRSS